MASNEGERRLERAAARAGALAAAFEPPAFEHVPDPDSALFLCAIDHKAGYRNRYLVDGRGPFRGSALMWAVGLRTARRGGIELRAEALREVSAERVAGAFRIGGETVRGPATRAELWRDLAAGLVERHGGTATGLLAGCGAMLSGAGGLLSALGEFAAYADPLQKKSFLFAKICERRGWLEVRDPQSWSVSADSVLMRLALRAGLVAPGEPEEVRAATRGAFDRVARLAGVPPQVLDDLLWERGREDPDLLGNVAGDVRETPRPEGTIWY